MSSRVRIRDVATASKIPVKPQEGAMYWHYSLPAFDAGMEPVHEDGSTIGSSKLAVQKGDILCNKLNMRFKRIWPIDDDYENAICSTEFVPIQATKVDRNYLYYVLVSDSFTKAMSGMRTGTSGSHQRVSVDWILDYEFDLPDESEQRQIACILSSIDGKIRTNSRANDHLADCIKALFRHWFVDFAPFAGKPYVDSEIGRIPSSVQLVPLKELTAVITKGTTPTTLGYQYTDDGINFIKGESIQDDHSFDYNKFAHIDNVTNDALRRSIIENRDLLFTIAGTLGRFAMAVPDILPANTNQAVGIIRAKPELIAPEVLLSYFLGRWHEGYYTRRIQQAVQANLSLTTLKSLPVPVLRDAKRREYEDLVIPMVHAIEACNAQNRKLAELRDALLPKLMSGEIDVSKVELPTQPNNHL